MQLIIKNCKALKLEKGEMELKYNLNEKEEKTFIDGLLKYLKLKSGSLSEERRLDNLENALLDLATSLTKGDNITKVELLTVLKKNGVMG